MTTEQDREPLSSEVKRLEGEVGPHAHHPLLHLPIFEQLKQRNVFRVAVLYAVVCWLILDPVHVIFHMAGVPEWVNRLVLILMAVGFPVVVIFAWVYEITPEGMKPTVEVPHAQSIRKLTGRRLDRAIIAVLTVALAYFVVDKFWISRHFAATQSAVPAAHETVPRTSVAAATVAAFAPPPHSIAVLPFVNLSGDKDQEYFSDGLTEEVLNSLAQINDLQVAARTSSFSFREPPDIVTVARKLNVAAVLEGSVRRSAHTVRITVQLINAVTGFHLWSKTYDRDLGDVLKLQTEIATAVANALQVTLLGDAARKIELGGTRNPAAFDAYLTGSRALNTFNDGKDLQAAAAAYSEAIRLDPNYALAYAGRARAYSYYAEVYLTGTALRETYDKAQADARQAIALAPDLAEGHAALANYALGPALDFTQADEAYERALALAPGNAAVLDDYGPFAVFMGRADAGVAASRHAAALDPLNPVIRRHLGQALNFARRYDESVAALQEAVSLDPGSATNRAWLGFAYYTRGDFRRAQSSCESKSEYYYLRLCLALSYERLGRHAYAEAALAKLRAALGDAAAYQYAEIYAQWGNISKALEWLETAMRLRDPGLLYVKTDPFLDPLRKEPRFQAIERKLKFPDSLENARK